jgi:hypothetical protein
MQHAYFSLGGGQGGSGRNAQDWLDCLPYSAARRGEKGVQTATGAGVSVGEFAKAKRGKCGKV